MLAARLYGKMSIELFIEMKWNVEHTIQLDPRPGLDKVKPEVIWFKILVTAQRPGDDGRLLIDNQT